MGSNCSLYFVVIVNGYRAENNGQQVAGHDDGPNIFQPGQTSILAGQIMNTNNFFLPKEYPIMLAIDRYYYIDVHIFDSKLVKTAFARCRVPFGGFCAF